MLLVFCSNPDNDQQPFGWQWLNNHNSAGKWLQFTYLNLIDKWKTRRKGR